MYDPSCKSMLDTKTFVSLLACIMEVLGIQNESEESSGLHGPDPEATPRKFVDNIIARSRCQDLDLDHRVDPAS